MQRWMNTSNPMFVGRRWLFNQLDNLFQENNDIRGVLIVGNPGSGKTAIMKQLVSSQNSSRFIHKNIIAYHFCQFYNKTTHDGNKFVRSLVEQLSEKVVGFKNSVQNISIENELDKCKDDTTRCVEVTVLEPLNALKTSPEAKKFILIDALDECCEKERNSQSVIIEILHGQMTRLPTWIKLLMSSRNETTITGKMSEIFQTIRIIPISATNKNNLDDMRSYAQGVISRHNFKMKNGESIKERLNESIKIIMNQSDGNFLFIHELLEDWVKHPDSIDLTSIPPGMKYLYARSFRERFQKDELQRFAKIFEILLASNLPPTFKRLHGILTSSDQMDDYKLDEVKEKLSSFLNFEHGTVRIFHQSFAEWLTNHDKPINGFSIKKSRGHQYIADYLFEHYNQRRNEMTVQGLYELSLHVLNGEMLPKHVKKLEDLNSRVIDRAGECILHYLARNRESTAVLEVFIRQFDTVNISNNKGFTPSYYATEVGNYLNLDLLIRNGADVNHVPYSSESYHCEELIFPHGIYSFKYNSLTFIAAYKGYSNIVELLINYGARFYKEEMCGWKPLHAAARKGSLKSAELLMNNTDSSSNNMFGFHLGAIYNHSDVLKLFLENGVRDKCMPCNKNNDILKFSNSSISQYFEYFCGSVLNIAVGKKNQKMVKMLLSYGKETLECKSLAGLTPLMQAVERKDSRIVTLLLDEGADVKAQCEAKSLDDSFQMSRFLTTVFSSEYYCSCTSKAIHISAIEGTLRITTKLIERNANPLSRDSMGWLPNDLAAMHNQYIDTNLFKNKTIIQYLALCGSVKAFKKLLRNYSNINDVVTSVDENGMTLVHLATLGLTNVFSSVCNNLSFINCTAFKCPYMNGFRKYNLEEQYFKTIKLLTKVAPQHVNKKDKDGRTALHYSVIVRSPRVFKHLIQKGSDWKIKDKNGNTALKFALKRSLELTNLGPCSTVFYALFNASNITISDEMHVYCLKNISLRYRRMFYSVILKTMLSSFEKLVQNNLPSSWYTLLTINVYLYDPFLMYPAVDYKAKKHEVLQVIDLFLELFKVFKPDVEVKCEVPWMYSIWHVLALNSTGWTSENYLSLQRLVDTHPMGFRIFDEHYDANGYLPIHHAALMKSIDMIDWFINNGGNIWKKTRSGWTSFHLLLTDWHCPPHVLDKLLSNITSNSVYHFFSGFDFWCNTTSAPLSLLHVAARNFKCLSYIQNNSFIPIPYLPFTSCDSTHGITLLYLIQLNNGVTMTKLTAAEWKDLGLATDETILTYPEREAEYHLIYYTFFFPTPIIGLNLKFELNSLDLFRLPGISEVLPHGHVIQGQIKRCNDRCWHSAFHAYRSFTSFFPTVFIRNDTFDSRSDGFIDIVQQMAKIRHHCIKMFYKVNIALWKQVSMAYSCSYKCRCLEIKRLLQEKLLLTNLKYWLRVTRFIAERMGWNVTSGYDDVRNRWPFDFLLKKALKMDKDYDYLKILS